MKKILKKSKRSTRDFAHQPLLAPLSQNRSQSGVEYMIVIGFVSFAVMVILLMSGYYSNLTKDKIRMNQIESFAEQLINNAETVFFAGEPSEKTVNLYLPSGVKEIIITSNSIVMTISSSSGDNLRSFGSNVPLQEGSISNVEGVKVLSIKARENFVVIEE